MIRFIVGLFFQMGAAGNGDYADATGQLIPLSDIMVPAMFGIALMAWGAISINERFENE